MEDKQLIKNARKPEGELGHKILDRMNKSHEELAIWGAEHLNIKSTDHVLDIGCGGGVNVKRFAKIATKGKVCGIDYSDVSVEKSIKLNNENIEKGLVSIMEGSVSNLPFEDNSFDIITAFETVYFWPNFLNDLKEVLRVLKPGGTFLICNEAVIDDNTTEKDYKELIDLLKMKIYSQEEFNNYLIKAGFKNIEFDKRNKWICVLSKYSV